MKLVPERVHVKGCALIEEDALPVFMQNDLVLLLLNVYGALFLLGPIILRATFRFKAKLDPQFVSLDSLSPDVG